MGLILENFSGDEITYAMRFDFVVSNNKFEYEERFAGLLLAQEVRAKHISAFSNLFLFTNQVNRTYKAKDNRMQRYLDAT